MIQRLALIACIGNAVVGCVLLAFGPDPRVGLFAFGWSVVWFAVWSHQRL